MKLKYGTWNKNPNIVQNWNRADWFVNNRELYYSKTQVYPIKILTSQKNITTILTLYAICDLTIESTSKDYFNIEEIRSKIIEKLPRYKLMLKAKGLHIIERVCKAKYRRSNYSYDYMKDMKNQKNKLQTKIDNLYLKSADKGNKTALVRRDDIYYSIEKLRHCFINFKLYVKKDKDYSSINFENDYSASRILYYLNDDGKELLKKYSKEKYLF